MWAIHSREVREAFKALGFPVGRKAQATRPPSGVYAVRDYLRGWIDADGSVGRTGEGKAFVSLTTQSAAIKDLFVDHVQRVTGRRKVATRNRRDRVFNLVVLEWMAYDLVTDLYYPGCLALRRKYAAARRIAAEPRPPITRDRRTWLNAEDEIVLQKPAAEAARLLGRTEKSVTMRRWRLTKSISIAASAQDQDPPLW